MDTTQRMMAYWDKLLDELGLAKERKELPMVAARAGCSLQALYKYMKRERGKNVPIKSVYKLAKGLGYTEEEIRIELYGDTKYLYMVDNHKALMDKIYDKLVKKQISEEKIHAMIDIVDNS